MSRTPKVSVVIPAHNAVVDLPEQLLALSEQDTPTPFEVIVADNRSTDGLVDFIDLWMPKVPYELRLVDASGRRGVAHARNMGCRAARGDLILVCDADDVVLPGWVSAMVEALDDADLAGGTLVTDRINSDLVRAWRPMYPAGMLPSKLGHLPYAVGANTGMKRSVFDELGGWDEEFVGGGDDVEFSWRAQHAGFVLRPAPEAVIRYRLRTGLRDTLRQSYVYARSDAQLLATFTAHGASSTGWKPLARECLWLTRNVRGLTDAGPRGLWLRRVAMLAGRAHGSFVHRAWAL